MNRITPTCSILLRTAVVAVVIEAAASVAVDGVVAAAVVALLVEAVREEVGTPPFLPPSPPRSL